MPEVNHKDFEKYLAEQKAEPKGDQFAPVYLIFGEELLVKNAFKALLDFLLPESKRSLNFTPYEGGNENIPAALEQVNTFSLMPGTKVIGIQDSKVFYSKQDKRRLFENARQASANDALPKAAANFLNLLGHLNLSHEDVDKDNRHRSLDFAYQAKADDEWIDDVLSYIAENNLKVPSVAGGIELLEKAIEKKFPADNHLIITTDLVDKRRSLFKAIRKHGVIIDCSVPKGERRADKIAQASVLEEQLRAALTQSNKTMDKQAYAALFEMTGFDMRTFSNNLDKLISYIGQRDSITLDDVKTVVQRTKQDPIFELTNAVSDRSLSKSLFFLNSLLSAEMHPLQVLAAITNQIRKLLMVKGFVESEHGSGWYAGCQYPFFQKNIMPAITAYDQDLLNHLEEWEIGQSDAASGSSAGQAKPKKKRKSKVSTDLTIAKNPKNAYPVFLSFKKSDLYTKQELIRIIDYLVEADLQLKSSAQNPALLLESLIMRICRKQNENNDRGPHGLFQTTGRAAG